MMCLQNSWIITDVDNSVQSCYLFILLAFVLTLVFDIACFFSPELCGTPGYLSPEALQCSMFGDAPGYSKEVDV